MVQISVIIPLYNEEESLPELTSWIERVMAANGFSYEIIFVNDGSTDGSQETIRSLAERNPAIRYVAFARNYGKSPALNVGFARAEGDVVITMDADLQDSPDEIPELYRMITEEGYDLVSGWKRKRYDPLSKTIPTGGYGLRERVVALALPTGDKVVALLSDHAVKLRDLVGGILEIGVHGDDDIPLGAREADVEGRRLAVIACEGYIADGRIALRKAADCLLRAVGRAVVDKYYLIAEAIGGHHAFDPGGELRERLLLVV